MEEAKRSEMIFFLNCVVVRMTRRYSSSSTGLQSLNQVEMAVGVSWVERLCMSIFQISSSEFTERPSFERNMFLSVYINKQSIITDSEQRCNKNRRYNYYKVRKRPKYRKKESRRTAVLNRRLSCGSLGRKPSASRLLFLQFFQNGGKQFFSGRLCGSLGSSLRSGFFLFFLFLAL